MNENYFEHAYIARYLGFMLLEGEDLTMRGNQLMVRTVAGLRPVSVLWRRLDAAWADPLELDETSRLGTPGMLGAIRAGNLTMVNALGSGVLKRGRCSPSCRAFARRFLVLRWPFRMSRHGGAGRISNANTSRRTPRA